MVNSLYQADIISMKDLTKDQIQLILATAKHFKQQNENHNLLKNKIIAHCFFEPSTRTRLSFEAATLKLGGSIIGFSSDEQTSIKKGESLHDTIKIIENYSDLIVIRHNQEGGARFAAEVSNKPVINAGDAANQHPTQALLDLFSIQECQNNLSNLNIALAGDLKYSRTIHSLIQGLAQFDNRLFLVSPEILSLPESIFDLLKKQGIRFSCHQNIQEVIHKIDILYMTRIQQERLSEDELNTQNNYYLTTDILKEAKPNLKILHPLPRLEELPMAIDQTEHAYYFQQAANGLWVRQALLSLLCNDSGLVGNSHF